MYDMNFSLVEVRSMLCGLISQTPWIEHYFAATIALLYYSTGGPFIGWSLGGFFPNIIFDDELKKFFFFSDIPSWGLTI